MSFLIQEHNSFGIILWKVPKHSRCVLIHHLAKETVATSQHLSSNIWLKTQSFLRSWLKCITCRKKKNQIVHLLKDDYSSLLRNLLVDQICPILPRRVFPGTSIYSPKVGRSRVVDRIRVSPNGYRIALRMAIYRYLKQCQK